jgi:hypothetical protein
MLVILTTLILSLSGQADKASEPSNKMKLFLPPEIKCVWVRFQVLTAASMKITIFWDVAPCSLVEVYRRFRGAYCLDH